MIKIIYVGIGGFIGAALRYIITLVSNNIFYTIFPMGTLIVNLLASFLIGFILEGSMNVWNLSESTKLLLTTGMLGGLSTFSTFSYETYNLMTNNNIFLSGINILLNVILCLVGVYCGKQLISLI